MFKHIVVWKLKDFAEGAAKAENARKMKAILEELKEKITVIKALEVGININGYPDSYDVVLYAEFDNAADFQKYRDHPEHLKGGEFVSKVRLERKTIDYET